MYSGLLQDETIIKYYNETYDEISNVHDGTPTCSPYNDDSLEGLLPCDLFSKEEEYKDVNEDSWTFIENTIYDMYEEENNEP